MQLVGGLVQLPDDPQSALVWHPPDCPRKDLVEGPSGTTCVPTIIVNIITMLARGCERRKFI